MEAAIWHVENLDDSWLKPFLVPVRQLAWSLDYMDDIAADFLFMSGVFIAPENDDYAGMNSRRFFSLVKRLLQFEGCVQRRMVREFEEQREKKKQEMAKFALPNGKWHWKALAEEAKRRGATLERA